MRGLLSAVVFALTALDATVQAAARMSTARARGAHLLSVLSAAQEIDVEPKKVKVELYMESMCPFCSTFLQGALTKAWEDPIIRDIMEINVIPYGNAHEIPNPTAADDYGYQCQHGPNECRGNLQMACAKHVLKDSEKWFPYIRCLEIDNPRDPASAASECENILMLPDEEIVAISHCVTSDLGKKLIHENAVKTMSLKPPHKYVPWIVVNDKHTDELQAAAQSDLIALVCELYTGKRPTACPTNSSYRE
ncbi:hypothetical protein SARC_01205 [Sphaeroforma arctica JP610]|uniref:Saposin A-type domain-containing protein n=1 Tax=Sphaeroforma arctica JP610 TaxID=667725 RepID=A0A0L0GEK0_9EUKA|nr:hypothetical protein SARC_01205 [Sphaeroforma arctica JP610]KNC86668.1 hypothetical protein SARC_01205 [Sphaeroforma arctica JP610]|eukprot:XP_014160570.1 hypothetical protein SARC_01205 [Sphaeroforma arctica JP610]